MGQSNTYTLEISNSTTFTQKYSTTVPVAGIGINPPTTFELNPADSAIPIGNILYFRVKQGCYTSTFGSTESAWSDVYTFQCVSGTTENNFVINNESTVAGTTINSIDISSFYTSPPIFGVNPGASALRKSGGYKGDINVSVTVPLNASITRSLRVTGGRSQGCVRFLTNTNYGTSNYSLYLDFMCTEKVTISLSDQACPTTSYIYLGTTDLYDTPQLACQNRNSSRAYFRDIPVLSPNLIVYEDSLLMNPLNGQNKWIALSYNNGFIALQIDGAGKILQGQTC
jgi:hypothetical protein